MLQLFVLWTFFQHLLMVCISISVPGNLMSYVLLHPTTYWSSEPIAWYTHLPKHPHALIPASLYGHQLKQHTNLPTCFFTSQPTNLVTLFTYPLTNLPLPTHLPTCLPTECNHLPTILPINLCTYLPTHPPLYLPIYPPTCLPTNQCTNQCSYPPSPWT